MEENKFTKNMYCIGLQKICEIQNASKKKINFVLFSRDEEHTEIDPQANGMTSSKLVSRSFYVLPDNFPLSSGIRYVCVKFEISHLTFV